MNQIYNNKIIANIHVRNFLIDEYKNTNANIHLYAEFNIGDGFTDQIEQNIQIHQNLPQHQDSESKNIEAFINIINKGYSRKITFENLYKLLSKYLYPINTQIQLIYVSSDTDNPNIRIMEDDIKMFDKYKQHLLGLSDNDLYTIINNLKNMNDRDGKLRYENEDINSAFGSIFGKFKQNELIDEFDKNIDKLSVVTFKQNLPRCTIRELTLEELINVPMSRNVIAEEFGIFRGYE